MARVFINRKEDFEKMFRNFKMQCKREGIVREYRDRQQYLKPSERKRIERGRKKKF
ncbi:MAG: 30S ribosomal protein S21 [Candidatus Omnitrophota bacterium]